MNCLLKALAMSLGSMCALSLNVMELFPAISGCYSKSSVLYYL